MTWKQEMNWHGYRLTLTRNESEPKPQTGPALPPAPGAGDIRFPALYLFSNGEALHLEAEISGNKIARLYLDVQFENDENWLAGPVCRRKVAAPHSREIGGVHIPMWAENNKVSAIWQPAMPLLVCGEVAAFAFTQPSQSNPQERWLYATRVAGDKEQSVRLSFSAEGSLTRMAAVNSGSRGLHPQPGDQIIPAVNWLRREGNGWQSSTGNSNPITITDQPLRLLEVPAPPGRYQIGLLVLDLDSQSHRRAFSFEIPAAGLIHG